MGKARPKIGVSEGRSIDRRQYKVNPQVKEVIEDTKVEKSEQSTAKSKVSKNAYSGSFIKILLVLIAQLPLHRAYPIRRQQYQIPEPHYKDDPEQFWTNMAVSAILVILGGVFAGLTLGLMGQDEIYLQVMVESGEPSEQKNAKKVLNLLKRSKHWVLVTLLLSNVITNETLPIVLDRCLGGGWPAVVSSTIAIVIFGEIIPQSICVRYGLEIGATLAPFVLALMYFMYPVAYPIALLLDRLLGEDHGTMYKRAGLKTLVTLHQNMGVERLNEDEVTIISAVLDLKEKAVGSIMTPMQDVFVMSSDRILDEATIDEILNTGFNRIPIHAPDEPANFVGMLLVRILISYDPEDALPISSFPLATLPETGPETSCLNILNYFQEGKSHMVIVSETPGESAGSLGVLTLEDVIEELIGEEIVDESDVYVDVHKAIRRKNPGPLSKRLPLKVLLSPRASFAIDGTHTNATTTSAPDREQDERSDSTTPLLSSPQPVVATLATQTASTTLPKLGPMNKASNPRATVNKSVTIKQPSDMSSNMAENISVYGSEHEAIQSSIKKPSNAVNKQVIAQPKQETKPNDEESLMSLTVDNNRRRASRTVPEHEVHSYRTGGIIESVVDVHGVKKTVIEESVEYVTTSDENSNGNGHNWQRRYSRSRRSDSDSSGNLSPLTNGTNGRNKKKKTNGEWLLDHDEDY